MKKSINELLAIRDAIKMLRSNIVHVKKSTFFTVFGTEAQRLEEIEIHKAEIRKLLKHEFTALENLQKQCEQAKVKNSYQSRITN